VALLSQKGLLLRNYSQNIDGLEFLAGIPSREIVECHGHFRSASCIVCHRPSDDCERTILETNDFPTCNHCGGYVKPDIVFFGEGMPDRFSRLLPDDLEEADLLLIMGTSLMVAPVSMIPNMVDDACKRVLLNRERVGDLHDEERDVIHEGDCDDSVRTIARLLNWEEELLKLNASTLIKHKKEKQNSTSRKRVS
jgi:NAD-dependent SIR2 family protein deacetylase